MPPINSTCAHPGCTCRAGGTEGVEREGRSYCSQDCANDRGCNHAGCNCRSAEGDAPARSPSR